MDNRAVTPVVGKLLAAGLAVLYIAGMTSLLLGGVVPDYRTEAGGELSDRVLATAAGSLERALPDSAATVDATVETDLPATIRDETYRLVLRDGSLRLDHPDDRLDARVSLALPNSVTALNSTWRSSNAVRIRVQGPPANRTVRLAGGSA